jgi:PST family polysaccharide transporter
MVGQTLGSKIASFASQVVLARLLLPRDFGLVALAYAAVALAGVVRQTGIQQILVQRHGQFRRWVNPAFWFEFTIGCAAALLLAAASPLAAAAFHSKALIGLILVIASAAPLSAFFVVPTAKLMIDMRFRAIALANIGYNFTAMALSIFLAWRHFGAYSFVIPLPIAGAARVAILWYLARPQVSGNPQFRRWKFLVKDSGLLLLTGFLGSIMFWAGNMALGLGHSKTVVGQFFFALNLSLQVAQLLSQNLGSVLLPALAKLQGNIPRQAAALIRAARMLAFVSVPLCVFLLISAKPLIVLVYGLKWLPSVPILQVLALVAAINIPGGLALTAMQSQGRFSLLLWWTTIQATVFFAAVLTGSWLDSAVGVATAMLIFQIPVSPVSVRLAARGHATWGDIWKIYAGPAFASAVASIPVIATLFVWNLRRDFYLPWVAAALVLFGVIYPLAGSRFCPNEFADLKNHVLELAAKVRKRRPEGML